MLATGSTTGSTATLPDGSVGFEFRAMQRSTGLTQSREAGGTRSRFEADPSRYDGAAVDGAWTPAAASSECEYVPNAEGDRQVLAALRQAGSDLSKPAHTIHFLYFKSMDAARGAADELLKAGYENVRAGPAPSGSLLARLFGKKQYSCIAETRAVPEESAVLATSAWMDRLAARLGGEYDGWEASVEK
jgi:hypothetical protein